MKRQLINFFTISALMLQITAMHAMNYVQSAYRQAASTFTAAQQNIKQQVNDVKDNTQRLMRSINCVQNTLGCSAVQMMELRNALSSLDLSLTPLLGMTPRLSETAKSGMAKSIVSIKKKVNELQASLNQAINNRFAPEQKASFISGAKKVAIAAAALVAVAAIAGITKVVLDDQIPLQGKDDGEFMQKVRDQDIDGIKNMIKNAKPTVEAMQAALRIINSTRDYPDQSNMLRALKIAIATRGGTEFYKQKTQEQQKRDQQIAQIKNRLQSRPQDSIFIGYVIDKNMSAIQNAINNGQATSDAFRAAIEIIQLIKDYPNRDTIVKELERAIDARGE